MAWNVSLMLHYFHLEGRSEMRLEYPMSSWAELEPAQIVYENARECVFTRTVCFRAGFRHIQVTTVPESGVVKLFELISNKRFWYVDADNPTLQKSSLLGDLWHSLRIGTERIAIVIFTPTHILHTRLSRLTTLSLSVVQIGHEMSPKH